MSQLSFCCLKSSSISKLNRDIWNSKLITHPPTNLSRLVDSYNSTLSSLLDKHAPLKTKTIRAKPPNPWFTPALSKLKSARRHLEKIWLRIRSSRDLKLFRSATNTYHSAIIQAKKSSTLHSSLHPLLTLASSGTLSITFFIVNLLLDSHPTLILNLYLICLLLSSRIKLSNFMLVLSINLSIHHLTPCLIRFRRISLSLVLLLEKCLNSLILHFK